MQIRNINLYALSSCTPLSIRTVAYDTDRWLNISLDIDMTQIVSAVLYCNRGDNVYTSNGTISDGIVSVQIPSLPVNRYHASLVLTDTNNKVITTFPFEIRTEENYAV